MKLIDAFLNRITMYRLVLLGLLSLAAISIACAFFQWLPFTALQMSISLVVLVASAWLSNKVFAIFAKASPTPESSIITGLILFFVFTPLQSAHDGLVLVAFACVAMLSKYILAYNRKHIFNPAAVAALLASVLGTGIAGWWVGTPILAPFVIIIGFLFVRKLRRLDIVLSFFLAATIVFLARLVITGTHAISFAPLVQGLEQFIFSWPLLFFATVMLTEPQTSPPYRSDRIVYGVVVGFLFSLAFNFGPVSATPEFALVIGNIFAYAVGFRKRVTMTLKEIVPLTRDIFEYVFLPDKAFQFAAGQYGEWTLPHRAPDSRGIRRFFTIASAPEDPFVRLAMRTPVEGSSFKSRMKSLIIGSQISMTGISGSFTLPDDPNEKIAAIAGGIGVTPFMSMFRHLAERHEHRSITLIYTATSPLNFAYQAELDALAPAIGLKVLYLPTDYTELTSWQGKSGFLSEKIIKEDVRDFDKRIWYISGPDAMVRNYKQLVQSMGVASHRVKTDYFQGL